MDAFVEVTAVIPYFRSEESIHLTLKSLVDGTKVPREIIVVDDGSPIDSSQYLRRVVQEIGHPKIWVLRLKSNCGGGFARNAGIHEATSDLVLMIDSDNLASRTLLEDLVGAANSGHIGHHIFVPERFVFFPKGGPAKVSHAWTINQRHLQVEDVLRYAIIPAASGNYLFTKESWQRAGGYPTRVGSLDAWGFGLRQLIAGFTPNVVPGTHYFHSISPDSYWAKDSHDMASMSLRATSLLLESAPLIPKAILNSVLRGKNPRMWYSKLRVPDQSAATSRLSPGFQTRRDSMKESEIARLETELNHTLGS